MEHKLESINGLFVAFCSCGWQCQSRSFEAARDSYTSHKLDAERAERAARATSRVIEPEPQWSPYP